MILFSDLVRIDRALAAAAGGDHEAIFHALGAHSAERNLAGLYASYEANEVHAFFQSMSVVHRAFQDFGKSSYERLGERSGRVSIARYREFSPVFCSGGCGYYEEALRLMKVPGPIQVREVACHCAGNDACVFELSW
jgi:predicted hydrocarbon binding protein